VREAEVVAQVVEDRPDGGQRDPQVEGDREQRERRPPAT
jgi:hypothetical protein